MGRFTDIKELMTAKEVAELFGYSVSSLTNSFQRIAAAIKKKYNVDVVKCYTNGQVLYQIFENSRALTIYEQENDILVSIESLSFEAYQFFVFLALAASPQGVFRGCRAQLLKYVGIKSSKKSLEMLDKVIDSLVKRDYIVFHEDEDVIILYLRTKMERQNIISITMLRECRRIADENHKNVNKVSQLLQVWEAIRICEQKQPFKYADLVNITGLSYKQIRDVKRLLESNDAFRTSRAGTYLNCLGMNVDLNGFVN